MLSPADAGDRSGGSSSGVEITEQQPDERTSVLALEGELDLSTAPQLKWRLVDTLGEGKSQLVLDLSRVTFMDSTALGVLVSIRRSVGIAARLAIVCVDPDVLRIFEVSGLDGAFAIFATREDALAYVRGEEPPRT